jgi:hypothetical protein
MVRQVFNLFGQTVSDERLQGFNDAGMQYAPPLLQEAAIGHFVGEGMLEGEFALGEEPRLIEKLGSL